MNTPKLMSFFQPHADVDKASYSVLSGWFALLFLAGMINAGGFLAAERFVTHITGFATLIGIDFALGRFQHSFGLLTVPVYFLGGAILSAVFVEGRIQKNRPPRYDLIMLLVTLCLFATGLFGTADVFGTFGESAKLHKDYFFLALLCLASGLLNAAITRSSGSTTVRTTHLTGITTDLGLGIVRLFHLKLGSVEFKKEFRICSFRVGSIFSFIFGSGFGAFVFLKIQYMGFFLPGLLAGLAFWGARRQLVFARIQAQKEKLKY